MKKDSSEFSVLVQRARDMILLLADAAQSRQYRRELWFLSRIMDDLERLNSKDPPRDWSKAFQLLITVVEFAKKIFLSTQP